MTSALSASAALTRNCRIRVRVSLAPMRTIWSRVVLITAAWVKVQTLLAAW